MAKKQLECRIVITRSLHEFELGMYDPLSLRYEPLGKHPVRDIDPIVAKLRRSIEGAGHRVSYSEVSAPR